MKHIITTRCSFQDDELFQKYFEVMKKMYIPSVCAQTVKNFKLYISTDRKTNSHHKDLIAKEFKGSDVDLVFDITDIKSYMLNEKYNIQSRHDCDDWMSPLYVERIQSLYSENINKHDEFMIHAQPSKYDFETGKEYAGIVYKDTSTSMFLSLCQKNPTKHIFLKKHAEFPQIVPTVFNLGEGLVKLVIHKNNRLSKISSGDKKL